MEGFVYILQSEKNERYYIGSTIDISRRFAEHNNGKNASTKNLRPWMLVFSKKYCTIKEARKIELKLKKTKNRNIIK